MPLFFYFVLKKKATFNSQRYMKKIFFIVFVHTFFLNYGQNDLKQQVVSVHSASTYTVNSKNYMGNGKTVVPISIFLPDNTKELVYTISTSKRGSVFSGSSILAQSSELLQKSPNPIFNFAGVLIAPTSNEGVSNNYKVNTYFLDDKNYQLYSGNLPSMHYPDLSRQNITTGTVGVRFPQNLTIKGRHWLILENQSEWTGVDVSVEIIAITEQKEQEQEENILSSGNSKSNMLYKLGVGFLNRKQYDKAEEHFSKSIEIDENNGLSRTNLGLIKLINGENDEASSLYIEAVNIFKKDKLNGKNNLINEYNNLVNYMKNNAYSLALASMTDGGENSNYFVVIRDMLYQEIQSF